MDNLIKEIIDNVNHDVIKKLLKRFNLEENIASNILEQVLPDVLQTIKSCNPQELMPLVGQFTGGSPDLEMLKNSSLVQKVLASSSDSIKKHLKCEDEMSSQITNVVLPLILKFMGDKYGKNPLSLLSLLSNDDSGSLSSINSVVNSLGSIFGGKK